MKNFFCFAFLFFIAVNSLFSKELEGKSLEAIQLVIESNIQIAELEELNEKLGVVDRLEEQIAEIGDEISDEAKLICKTKLMLLRETAKAEDLIKQEKEQKKKSSKREKDPEMEKMVTALIDEYRGFEESHSDLSSSFYFHYKQAEFAGLSFVSTSKQLEAVKNIVDDYRVIAEMNPENGEVLLTYGMALYMAPKILGGDKVVGLDTIYKASQVSGTKYEKISAYIAYSQLMFEDKKYDEARNALNEADKLVPGSKTYKEIIEMNDAGYSMFKAKEYEKKKKK